jgi:hypothetical protein
MRPQNNLMVSVAVWLVVENAPHARSWTEGQASIWTFHHQCDARESEMDNRCPKVKTCPASGAPLVGLEGVGERYTVDYPGHLDIMAAQEKRWML